MNPALLMLLLSAASEEQPARVELAARAKVNSPEPVRLIGGASTFLAGYLASGLATMAIRPDQGGIGFVPFVGSVVAAWTPTAWVETGERRCVAPLQVGPIPVACLASVPETRPAPLNADHQLLAVATTALQLAGLGLLISAWVVPSRELVLVDKPASRITIAPTLSGVKVSF